MIDDSVEINLVPSSAPELHTRLRLAQLVILLDELSDPNERGLHVERLSYYDFFSANPFVIFGPDDVLERSRLHLAGFDERQLSYASAGSRFANRRQRLQHDLSLVVAYGLLTISATGLVITEAGREVAVGLRSIYADQYRESVRVIHARFKRLSDPQLARSARDWLKTPALVLDLYGAAELDPTEGI